MKPNLGYLKIRDFNDIIKTHGRIIDESVIRLFRLHGSITEDLGVTVSGNLRNSGWTSNSIINMSIKTKQTQSCYEKGELFKALCDANWLKWNNIENCLERMSKVFTCNYDRIIENYDKTDKKEFEIGKEYYRVNKEELMRKYPNEYIAIFNYKVVDNDTDFSNLASRVYSKYGYRPIYMPYISLRKRVVRIATPKLKRIE